VKKLIYVALALGALAVAAGPVTLLAETKAPGVVILKGSPMGGVKYDHPEHVKRAGGEAKCTTCHHKAPKDMPIVKCQDCHKTPPVAPMKTKTQLAFHDGMAKKGLCIDCHTTQGKGPTKCSQCHKKENV
jgi:hypothetical protein